MSLFDAEPARTPRVEVQVVPEKAFARAAAAQIAQAARDEVLRHGTFAICLSGGATPLAAYRLVTQGAGGPIPWERTHVFWGDERVVPVSDPRSNAGAVTPMLEAAGVPRSHIHPMPVRLGAHEAARAYERTLRKWTASHRPGGPSFDLTLLGLGADGHVASLFPGAPPPPSGRLVKATRSPEGESRVTLTLAAINASSVVLALVGGSQKNRAVHRILGPERERDLPGAQVAGTRSTVWLLDEVAARGLEHPALHGGNLR
jgi:6-phosphogluconolactonase